MCAILSMKEMKDDTLCEIQQNCHAPRIYIFSHLVITISCKNFKMRTRIEYSICEIFIA